MRNRQSFRQMFGLVLVVLILAGCGGAQATYTPTAPNTPTPSWSSVTYTADKQLHVLLPEGVDKPFPTLLLLHGAGLDWGSLRDMAVYFSERDYAIVAAEWQTGPWPPDGSILPNAFCALAWIHTNAETYGFDAQQIAVFGHSAGGQAAALLGSVDDPTEFLEGCSHQLPASNWTKAVMTYAGVFGTQEFYFTAEHAVSPDQTILEFHADQLGLSSAEKTEIIQTLMDTTPQSWREISGLSEKQTQLLHSLAPYWVDGTEPPFLLIHGKLDYVDNAAPEAFASQLEAVGAEAKVLMIPDAFHTDIILRQRFGFEPACQAMEAFLAEVLK